MSVGAAAATVAEMTAVAEDMPCCPGKASVPDRGDERPFMALCSATPFRRSAVYVAVCSLRAESARSVRVAMRPPADFFRLDNPPKWLPDLRISWWARQGLNL